MTFKSQIEKYLQAHLRQRLPMSWNKTNPSEDGYEINTSPSGRNSIPQLPYENVWQYADVLHLSVVQGFSHMCLFLLSPAPFFSFQHLISKIPLHETLQLMLWYDQQAKSFGGQSFISPVFFPLFFAMKDQSLHADNTLTWGGNGNFQGLF